MAKKKQFSLSLFLFLLILATIAGILIFSASLSRSNEGIPVAQAACGNKSLLGSSGDFDKHTTTAFWLGQPVTPLAQELTPSKESLAYTQVLGVTSDEKWIEVDLSDQALRAHEGEKVVYEFPVSSGKFVQTPTGEYRIWYKIRYTLMEGGVKGTGTYYYLPNVPYTMFFYQGFGLHGTYWHNNFGQPMSHGCVNLPIPSAEKLFYWAGPTLPENQNAIIASNDNPGTRVVVHD